MRGKLVVTLGLVLLSVVLQPVFAAENELPAIQCIPDNAIVALEVTQPEAVLNLAFSEGVIESVSSMPAYQRLAAQAGFRQFLGIIGYLETRLGTKRQAALETLLGGGVTLAVCPKDTFLLIIEAENGPLLENLHQILLEGAKTRAEEDGNPDRVRSAEYRGVTGWTFNGEEMHAVVGNRLLMSNKPDGLKNMVDLSLGSGGGNLGSLEAYKTAKQAAGPDAAAVAFVNMAVLNQVPSIRENLSQGPNPLASLLIPGITEALAGSNWLAVGLRVEGEELLLDAVVDDKSAGPSGPAPFAWPSEPDEGIFPNLKVPHQIASFSFYRDLHAFYAAKDELFPERTSGLILFENMMGIFFSGLDLTEGVLVETRPEVRVVVAEQQFNLVGGKPRVQYPGVAAVLRLRDPEGFGEVVEEAWQAALGLINFTRGQQGLPKMIIDRPIHSDVKFTTAYFSSAQEDDKTAMDARFNMRPALVRLGDYLVLSSAESLARDLIDALKEELAGSVDALDKIHSLAEVDGRQLAAILSVNRESMVRQNMVGEGNTRAEAESSIDLLTTLAGFVKRLELTIGAEDGQSKADVELELNVD